MWWTILVGCTAQAPVPEPAPIEPAPAVEPAPVAPLPAFDPGRCTEPLPLTWVPDGEGRGGLKRARADVPDLDGDGKPERFFVVQDAGSGFATVDLRLEPTASDPIGIAQTFSYNEMVHRIEIPEVLRGPDKAAWRAPFEQELLRLRCPEPDPSLRWIETGASDWIQGEPVVPPMYGLYLPEPAPEHWELYSAHTHTMWPPEEGGSWPVEDEVRGSLHLLRTLHGVILYDSDRRAHRWLWVSRQGHGKLRWRTVELAGFDGDRVVIERAGAVDPAPPALWVDPATGEVRELPKTAEDLPR